MQAPAGAQEAVFLQVGVARLQVNLHLLASLGAETVFRSVCRLGERKKKKRVFSLFLFF
jgi:hypothetical protein